MSDQDRIDSILAEYRQAAVSKQRELIEAHLDLAEELRKHFANGQSAVVDPTVSLAKAESDTASFSPTANDETLIHAPVPQASISVPTFGDYELQEEVAKGGMGVVYKARQISLDRVVARKMIRSGELAHDAEVERFRTEARAAANLEHSGILPIYEIGERNGQHFFTMAYIEGGSLRDLLVDGPLPPGKAAEFVQRTANAMQHAHEKGILHRDLKPANILVDPSGKPKVADFGLAKRMEEDSGLTASGTAMGTPSYMPPEQALGKGDEIGPQADIYSLGAVLYCLLTGHPLFAADNYLETIKQVIDKEPAPPRTLNPAIPKDLETICLKCLRKEQRSRYKSAAELAEDLHRWRNSEPIKGRRVGRLEKSWLWCKRRPVVAATLATVALVLIITAAIVRKRRLGGGLQKHGCQCQNCG